MAQSFGEEWKMVEYQRRKREAEESFKLIHEGHVEGFKETFPIGTSLIYLGVEHVITDYDAPSLESCVQRANNDIQEEKHVFEYAFNLNDCSVYTQYRTPDGLIRGYKMSIELTQYLMKKQDS